MTCVVPLLAVAVSGTVYTPGGVDAVVRMVAVMLLPLVDGIRDEGLKLQVMPVATGGQESTTEELNPFSAVARKEADTELAVLIVAVVVELVKLKSAIRRVTLLDFVTPKAVPVMAKVDEAGVTPAVVPTVTVED